MKARALIPQEVARVLTLALLPRAETTEILSGLGHGVREQLHGNPEEERRGA